MNRKKDGPDTTNIIATIPRIVRAALTTDLDQHVAFIRKSAANGVSVPKIAAAINADPNKVAYFIQKHHMVRNHPRSLKVSNDAAWARNSNTGPITEPNYKPPDKDRAAVRRKIRYRLRKLREHDETR